MGSELCDQTKTSTTDLARKFDTSAEINAVK